MSNLIVKPDCAIDLLAAFADALPLNAYRRKPVKTKHIFDNDSLQEYTDEEKELAYRFLLDRKYLELFIPPYTKPLYRTSFSVPKSNKTSVLQGPSKNHSICGVSPAGYELIKLASFPQARKKLSVKNVFENVCMLIEAGKSVAEILKLIPGL